MAALFAMGVFSAAGVGADMDIVNKPMFTLTGSDGNETRLPGATNVTLTVNFRVDQNITSSGTAMVLDLPDSLEGWDDGGSDNDFDATEHITVEQDDTDVGSTTITGLATGVSGTVSINPPTGDEGSVVKDTLTTITITNLQIDAAAALGETLTIVQGSQTAAAGDGTSITVDFHPSVKTGASIMLADDAENEGKKKIVLMFTADTSDPVDAAGDDTTSANNVVIRIPKSQYDLEDKTAMVTDGGVGGDTADDDTDDSKAVITQTEAVEADPDNNVAAVPAYNVITVSGFTMNEKVTVEIGNLDTPADGTKIQATFQQGTQPMKGAPMDTVTYTTPVPSDPEADVSSETPSDPVQITLTAQASTAISPRGCRQNKIG